MGPEPTKGQQIPDPNRESDRQISCGTKRRSGRVPFPAGKPETPFQVRHTTRVPDFERRRAQKLDLCLCT